jgi:predicted MFS family arabinose efflux permease
MYLGEFRQHWRVFVSACLGMGLGSAFSHYTASLFGPPLLAEFGWTRAQFALLGTIALINLVFVPVAGRIVDRFGTRLSAIVGFTVLPFGYLAFTVMSGSIVQYFAIWVMLHIFGVFTTTIVFARIIVEKFDRARGLALSLVLTASPFFSVIAVPLFGALIDTHGWRAGYVALAVLCAAGGWTSIAMMERSERATAAQIADRRLSRRELGELLRNPTLLLFLLAMFLVNIPQSFGTSQLKLVVMATGHSSSAATWMMSLYAGGVIVGRVLSGLALDRLPAHLVALAILGLPALGYVLLAGHVSTMLLLCLAVGVIGFAQGAETDIGAFLLSRRFDNRNFSLLIALMSAMVGLGGSAGSIVMSTTLHEGADYLPFLWLSAAGTLVGAVLFSLAGRARRASSEAVASAA